MKPHIIIRESERGRKTRYGQWGEGLTHPAGTGPGAQILVTAAGCATGHTFVTPLATLIVCSMATIRLYHACRLTSTWQFNGWLVPARQCSRNLFTRHDDRVLAQNEASCFGLMQRLTICSADHLGLTFWKYLSKCLRLLVLTYPINKPERSHSCHIKFFMQNICLPVDYFVQPSKAAQFVTPHSIF